MKKRKREEERDDEVREQQAFPQIEPLKPNPHPKRGKAKAAELFKRPPAMSLINGNTATMSQKYRGVACSL
jgi:hypothetical protein